MKPISNELKLLLEKKKIEHLKFGLPELEEALKISKTGGQVVILASRPSMGKTSLALQMASGFAENEDKPVAIYSIELMSQGVTLRLLAQKDNVQGKVTLGSKHLAENLNENNERISELSGLPIFINDDGEVDLDEIKSTLLKLKRQHGLGLVVIDYFQLLNSKDEYLRREDQVSRMMNRLKSLSKDLAVPIIILSQVSRGVEQRRNKRPQLSDFRETGAIEANADIILFLYREGHYYTDCTNPNLTEVIVAKNRTGETKTLNLVWNPTHTNFKVPPKEKRLEEGLPLSADVSAFHGLIVGEFNRPAVSFAKDLSIEPDQFSTVYISSEPGNGKSHLLCSISKELKKNHPNRKQYFASINDFLEDCRLAIQNNEVAEFKNRIVSVDFLLLDDIHGVENKAFIQEEMLVDIIRDMKTLKKLVIVTSGLPFGNLVGLNKELISEIANGTFLSIGNPELEFKQELLSKSCFIKGVCLNDSVITYPALEELSIREIVSVSEIGGVLKGTGGKLADEIIGEYLKQIIIELAN